MKDNQIYFTEEELDEKPAERNLLAALLDRAIRDMFIEDDRIVRREIRAWLDKKMVKNPQAFSFQWVCESLDLDAKAMRSIIKKMDRQNYRSI